LSIEKNIPRIGWYRSSYISLRIYMVSVKKYIF